MDPEQLVAQMAELRTQNQQLHQALQQMQQQQAQQQGLVEALTDPPQSLAQTVGAAVVAAANTARANPTLADTRLLGKSVRPGARDVLTWAVGRESAAVTEANAVTEVVMPLDTLRMLADQRHTLAQDLRMAALEALLPANSNGHNWTRTRN